MKIQSAINAMEKNGFTALECSNKCLIPYRKENAHVIIYKNGSTDQASMIEVKRFVDLKANPFATSRRGTLCDTIKSAVWCADKYISGEWK